MTGQKRNFAGPAIVITMIVLATLGGAMTWRNYIAERPSAVRAELVDEKLALAEFAPEKAPLIRKGAKVIVSVEGVRSTGYVAELVPSGDTTRFRLRLLEPFRGAKAGTPCQVTVDLSLPPELLKDSPEAP